MRILKDKRGVGGIWVLAITMIVIMLGILVTGLVVQYTDDLLPTRQTGTTAFVNLTLPHFTNALGNNSDTFGQLFRLMIIIPLVGIIALVMGAFATGRIGGGGRGGMAYPMFLRMKRKAIWQNRKGYSGTVWAIVMMMIVIILTIIVTGFIVTVLPTGDLPRVFLNALGNSSQTFGQLFRLMVIIPLVTIIAVIMGAFALGRTR